MLQYDVCRLDGAMVLVCQSDLLDGLPTRFVIPLGAAEFSVQATKRLNPSFEIGGERLILLPQYAFTAATRDLGPVIGSLAHCSFEITDAIDVLLSGV